MDSFKYYFKNIYLYIWCHVAVSLMCASWQTERAFARRHTQTPSSDIPHGHVRERVEERERERDKPHEWGMSENDQEVRFLPCGVLWVYLHSHIKNKHMPHDPSLPIYIKMEKTPKLFAFCFISNQFPFYVIPQQLVCSLIFYNLSQTHTHIYTRNFTW